ELAARLIKLPVAPALRLLGAKHRAEIIKATDGFFGMHRVRDVRPRRSRRAFGPQRQRLVRALEGEHLLFDHVGRLANRAHEELRMLEHGRAQLRIAAEFDGPSKRALEALKAHEL